MKIAVAWTLRSAWHTRSLFALFNHRKLFNFVFHTKFSITSYWIQRKPFKLFALHFRIPIMLFTDNFFLYFQHITSLYIHASIPPTIRHNKHNTFSDIRTALIQKSQRRCRLGVTKMQQVYMFLVILFIVWVRGGFFQNRFPYEQITQMEKNSPGRGSKFRFFYKVYFFASIVASRFAKSARSAKNCGNPKTFLTINQKV